MNDWYYISYASEKGFVGGCYVEALSHENAAILASALGIAPYGAHAEIAGPLPRLLIDEHVLERDRYRLLSKKELGPTVSNLEEGFG